MAKVVLITGASSGIGKETALLLLSNGYTVYGAARRIDKLKELESAGIKIIQMDVTDDVTMTSGVHEIIRQEGRLDVLINNAGFGSYGAIEDVAMEDAKYQMEVNLFGAARLIQLVLPFMRKQQAGTIINMSSIAGKISLPFGGWYNASKFAMEGLTDALRNEVRPFGIKVILIEPGGIKSEWAGISRDNLLKVSGHTAYKEMVEKMASAFNKFNSKVAETSVISKLVLRVIEKRNPKPRYAAGYMAAPALFFKKILPDSVMDRGIMSQFK